MLTALRREVQPVIRAINEEWARHDSMRPHHEWEYDQHAREQHDQREVSRVWLDTPHLRNEVKPEEPQQP